MACTPPVNYENYTHHDLLCRIIELEAKLRVLNASQPPPTTPPKYQKKPRKEPKPFDPSRYHSRFIALKFAYLGGNYNGFEHHTNNTTPLPTIEEEIWKALRKTRLIFPTFAAGRSEEEVCWDGVEYSKCGRTDRGVSAFGQVIAVRVRSSQPKGKGGEEGVGGGENESVHDGVEDAAAEPTWDSVRDEMPYIQLLNRVLPSDIRILAWCPDPPADFSARFSCKERRYRYFFTNPAYACGPNAREGRLDTDAMQVAAKKLEGLHDFRNLCKVDPSKQLASFERRVFHAGIHAVGSSVSSARSVGNGVTNGFTFHSHHLSKPDLYYFEVRGSAFLWHQVRHMVAILFLVGQGYEDPSIVDELLNIDSCPGKPVYDMADDQPLVLWDCIFPANVDASSRDHSIHDVAAASGHEDALEWVYVGDQAGGNDAAKRAVPGVDDGLYGLNGITDSVWALWRKRKMDEVLAGSLLDIVGSLGSRTSSSGGAKAVAPRPEVEEINSRSDRVFDGSDRPRTVGKYLPLMQREKLETPDVVNERYAVRKGLQPRAVGGSHEVDINE
ncbi:hypothetical protein LTR62_001426 [Meristemomyces frigidus]|uniref:Pseudouridine synthase I TruA alpha/beta domain-containing protein n=1 Tax=Meristemomyces frigidus TaxID=1508187 RepID=A0AAN7TGG2_9PEZI|nr:hypothetical protein LTR62_001426 [Meristemomyces frigidus]